MKIEFDILLYVYMMQSTTIKTSKCMNIKILNMFLMFYFYFIIIIKFKLHLNAS